MQLNVHKFISVEMIRDGGSFALKFETRDASRYILFTKIRHGECQDRELATYDEPVIIDCDPAKRPQDTKTRIYSELCGPASRVTWDQARQVIQEAGGLAQDLTSVRADWLKEMTAIIESGGRTQAAS